MIRKENPKWRVLVPGIGLLFLILPGCKGKKAPSPAIPQPEKGADAVYFTIQSSAFAANSSIPQKYTEDGKDISPELTWTGSPPAVQEYALIMDDPDAPTPQPWVHWIIYKIPAAVTSLPEAIPADRRLTTPVQALQGLNSWNTVGYRGPAPPRGHGVHHYHFMLYALEARLDLPAGMDKGSLRKAMEGHILAQTELIGTYQR